MRAFVLLAMVLLVSCGTVDPETAQRRAVAAGIMMNSLSNFQANQAAAQQNYAANNQAFLMEMARNRPVQTMPQYPQYVPIQTSTPQYPTYHGTMYGPNNNFQPTGTFIIKPKSSIQGF